MIRIALIFSMAAFAQEDVLFTLPAPPPGAAAGHTFEFISSEIGLPGKVVKGAPYSAEAVTETTQTLADGNRISRKNGSSVYRDSEGRTRREVTLGSIGPWASSAAAGGAKMVFIHDPVAGASYTLNENDKTARKVPGNAMVMSFSSHSVERSHSAGEVHMAVEKQVAVDKMIATTRALEPAPQKGKVESLGKRNIEGVVAEGTRTTHSIAAGEIGNDRPIDIVSERWYSPELQTVVMTRQADPRMGETIYKLSNLRRGEPARHLFEIPADYKVITEAPPKMFQRKLRSNEE